MDKLTSSLAIALCLLASASLLQAADLKLPLKPEEAKLIQAIASAEGVEVVLAPKPGFSARGAAETLVSLGVLKDDIGSVTIQTVGQEARAFTVTHDKAGHVLAITGNGPWLRNSTLRSFKGRSYGPLLIRHIPRYRSHRCLTS